MLFIDLISFFEHHPWFKYCEKNCNNILVQARDGLPVVQPCLWFIFFGYYKIWKLGHDTYIPWTIEHIKLRHRSLFNFKSNLKGVVYLQVVSHVRPGVMIIRFRKDKK